MGFPAFLDTCVLFSPTLTDTLLRIAEADAYAPLWSPGVLAELHTVLEREAGLTPAAAQRRITHMDTAFPHANVHGYDHLVDAMTCDPKDRHVLAAAITGGAEVLVTANLADFPPASLAPHHVTASHPDEFLLDQLDLHPGKVRRALVGQLNASRRPPLTLGQLLGRLSRAGVPRFAEEARRHEFA